MTDICSSCNNNSDSYSVRCALCSAIFHHKCSDISRNIASKINAVNSNLKYFCNNCNNKKFDVEKLLLDFKEQLNDLVSNFGEIFKKVESSVDKKVEHMFNELVTRNVKHQNNESLNGSTNENVLLLNTSIPATHITPHPEDIIDSNTTSQFIDDNITDSNRHIIKPASKRKFIYISRLDASIESDHIVEFIRSKCNVSNLQVYCKSIWPKTILRRNLEYGTFKIGVKEEDFNTVCCPSFWPNGIIVKEFICRNVKKNLVLAPMVPEV